MKTKKQPSTIFEAQKETHLFECSCESDSHILIIRYTNDEECGPELDLSYQLIQFRPFLKRLYIGLQYAFNVKRMASHWDYMSIKEEDIPKIIAIFQKAQKDWQKAGIKWEEFHKNRKYVAPKHNIIQKIGDKISDFGYWLYEIGRKE